MDECADWRTRLPCSSSRSTARPARAVASLREEPRMARKLAAAAAALFTLAAAPAASDAFAIAAHSVNADVAIANGNYMRIAATTGATPLGTLSIVVPGTPLSIVGSIQCMTVSGNTAYVVYRDTRATVRHNDGTVGGYVRLLDGADGDAQNNGRFAPRGLAREVADGCLTPTSGQAFHPLRTINGGTITIS